MAKQKTVTEKWDVVRLKDGNRVYQQSRLNPANGEPYTCTFDDARLESYCQKYGYERIFGSDGENHYVTLRTKEIRQSSLF